MQHSILPGFRRVTGIMALGLLCAPAWAQFQGPPVTTPVAPQLTGPIPGATPASAPAYVAPPVIAAITVAPGDTLEVVFVGIQAMSLLHPMVDSDGNISLPYIGPIHVGGLSLPAIQSLISQKYREGQYILNAQVNVQVIVAPSQVIAINGEVKTPTLVPSPGPRRLLEVIAAAGGLTPLASHLITVTRKSTGETIQVLLSSNPQDSNAENITLYSGDSVIVPKAGEIFVIGSVKSPNAFPLVTNTPLTVMQAISMAGGANFEAALSQVRIIRTEGSERKAISLDFKRVLDGKAADPILQADDIIYVPANYFKGALKANGVSTFASTFIGFSYLLK